MLSRAGVRHICCTINSTSTSPRPARLAARTLVDLISHVNVLRPGKADLRIPAAN